MITVTERAATQLEQMLVTSGALPGQGVRLVPSSTGTLGMAISAPSEGDEVIRRAEQPLLIVDSRIAGALEGSEIDCDTALVDGQPKTEFHLRAPT
jgi:Fe-S cluster assembly iron-binding protein IscA